jgi:hypothetical protein
MGHPRFSKPLGEFAGTALRPDFPGDFQRAPKFRRAVTGDVFRESAHACLIHWKKVAEALFSDSGYLAATSRGR